ncbi:MAG: CDP-alcohol phosphatidyltransferase family protein [Bacillota bacterium]
MGKYPWLTLPTLLSLSRIFMLPVLIWLAHSRPATFLAVYILVGATDYFDGLLARRYNWVTEAGKQFDSVGDVFLYLGSAYFLYVLFTPVLTNNLPYLYVFFVLLVLSLSVPVFLFKKLLIMHTTLLKIGAVLVYSLIILSFILDTTLLTRLTLVLYCIAFVETLLIYFLYGDVDPDTPSIFSLRS